MTQRYFAVGMCFLGLAVSMADRVEAENLRQTPTVKAVEIASPSVVNIHTEKTAVDRNSVFPQGEAKPRKVNGMGTGIVIDERGYIATNYHVVADVDVIQIFLNDQSEYTGTVVNFDAEHDLALLRVECQRPLTVMPVGTSSDLMLGETVIAVGNAYGYRHSTSQGIISALHRDVEVNATQSYKNLIQTDTAINPGNSGGPLLNINGELIGINVAIRQHAQRIGFAIPIDDARLILARLMSVEQLSQTQHGLITKDVKQGTTRKLVVDRTKPDSPATVAGLLPGDVVTKINDRDVQDGVDLERALLGRASGEKVSVTVTRGDRQESLSLALAPYVAGRSRLSANLVARANNDPTDGDRFWRVLGLKLAPLPSTAAGQLPKPYVAGMAIVEVRPQGPAALKGIHKNDVLVGLRDFEMKSADDVTWVLDQPPAAADPGMKFLIVRGQQAMYGFLEVTSDTLPAAKR
jgi:serine protease Do